MMQREMAFYTRWKWYYNKIQYTNNAHHQITHHLQTNHITQNYINNEGHATYNTIMTTINKNKYTTAHSHFTMTFPSFQFITLTYHSYPHLTSLRFTYHFPTPFSKITCLQESVPKASAGSWFQS
jgi:hypothetical protein